MYWVGGRRRLCLWINKYIYLFSKSVEKANSRAVKKDYLYILSLRENYKKIDTEVAYFAYSLLSIFLIFFSIFFKWLFVRR
jgi:hypothetical protein